MSATVQTRSAAELIEQSKKVIARMNNSTTNIDKSIHLAIDDTNVMNAIPNKLSTVQKQQKCMELCPRTYRNAQELPKVQSELKDAQTELHAALAKIAEKEAQKQSLEVVA
jgi:hypothetical protein